MSYPLAIFAPHIGARSETFIRRHMEHLLPGRTVVVAITARAPHGGDWGIDCPSVVLDQLESAGTGWRLFTACARRIGVPVKDHVINVVKRFLRDRQVKVAVGEYLDLALPWFRVCNEIGIKFFAHAHGYDVSERLRAAKWREEYLEYNRADGVITMSHVSRQKLLSLGLDARKVHVIPYGVEVGAQPTNRDHGQVVRCVAVGRMVAKKAPIFTLDAFRRAAEVCPNLRLDYVGTGELLPAVQHFIRAFNLNEKVTLHHGQSNEVVRELLKAGEIFVQHSITDADSGDEEGLPVAILEAMSHSLPVVSTRHAGIPEAVVDGTTGYLVEEGNTVAMADKLVALAQNPVLRRQMGTLGWERAKKYFSWEKERAELLNLFNLQP